MVMPINSAMTKEQTRVKRAIIIVVALLLIFIIGLSSKILSRHFDDSYSRSLIYGVWEEQNVPEFSQDTFEVRKDAVYIDERIVDTQYTFDGSILSYQFEGKSFEYKVLDDNITELQRISPLYYESMFYLRGKHKSMKN